MNEIILTDRWAKRSAEIDRMATAARRLFGMPPLVTCTQCGARTSNFITYAEGPRCAEYFACARRMDVAEVGS